MSERMNGKQGKENKRGKKNPKHYASDGLMRYNERRHIRNRDCNMKTKVKGPQQAQCCFKVETGMRVMPGRVNESQGANND